MQNLLISYIARLSICYTCKRQAGDKPIDVGLIGATSYILNLTEIFLDPNGAYHGMSLGSYKSFKTGRCLAT